MSEVDKNTMPLKIINIIGAPGVGKSTAAGGLWHLFKTCDVLAEYVSEFAKEMIYEKKEHLLKDQNFVFEKQNHKQNVLRGNVAVAVTDSPLILSAYYAPATSPKELKDKIFETFGTYENHNYFIERNPEFVFQQEGRMHNMHESDMIANQLKNMLDHEGIKYQTIMAGRDLPARIFADLAFKRVVQIPSSGTEEAIGLMERAAAQNKALSIKAPLTPASRNFYMPSQAHRARDLAAAATR